ncbi:MAG: hypothetical protein CME66_04725 [Halobacteriovoraceae bacterium]|nr:hypothetical protein [Halobacteriovoraceae bacterium]|tara:strand:+ start:48 stop:764 length:717 start_codon:yes stop_codon:yes gene_type:complete
MTIKTLILSGFGINCEQETAAAFEQAGATTHLIELHDFFQLKSFTNFDIIVFPGGFSYGDEIRSGKILAEQIKSHQLTNLKKFCAQGKLVLGICNGFQVLVQLGAFADFNQHSFTLKENIQGKFINKWAQLNLHKNNSPWLKDIDSSLYMPARHKEGFFYGELKDAQIVLSYKQDLNGSQKNIAGVCNKKGNILGLMPHPEAALEDFLFPKDSEKAILNQQIFKNAVTYTLEQKRKTP